MPHEWREKFRSEFDLLKQLAMDRDGTLRSGGITGPDAKQRMLEWFGGGKPLAEDATNPLVIGIQRLSSVIRLIAASCWPELYAALWESKDCKWPDASCMAKVLSLSHGQFCHTNRWFLPPYQMSAVCFVHNIKI